MSKANENLVLLEIIGELQTLDKYQIEDFELPEEEYDEQRTLERENIIKTIKKHLSGNKETKEQYLKKLNKIINDNRFWIPSPGEPLTKNEIEDSWHKENVEIISFVRNIINNN